MDKAEAWLQKASEGAQDRAPLKKLRELLHSGLRLGTDIPQVCVKLMQSCHQIGVYLPRNFLSLCR